MPSLALCGAEAMNAPLRHPVPAADVRRQETTPAAPVDIYAADRRIQSTFNLDALDQSKFQALKLRSAFITEGRS